MKSIPQIQKFMTVVPKSIGHDQTLGQALELMKTLNLRHLPVLKAEKLVGIYKALSELLETKLKH